MLLDHILSNPGVHFTELMTRFSLSEGTLRYHLHLLLKKDKIRSILHQGRRRYYPPRYYEEKIAWSMKMDDIRLNSDQRRILDIIVKEKKINQKDLSHATGTGRFRLRTIMKKLMDLGFVRSERTGREVKYMGTSREEIRRDVLRKLVSDLIKGRIDEETYMKAREAMDKVLF